MTPPFLPGLPMSNGGQSLLFAADFSLPSLGAHSISSLRSAAVTAGTPSDLLFSRLTGSTVQTSLTTVDSSAGVDAPVVGTTDGINKGLIIQPTKCLYAPGLPVYDPRGIASGSGYSAGTLDTYTANDGVGPDGQMLADRVMVAAPPFPAHPGGYSRYFGGNPAHNFNNTVFSVWSPGGGVMGMNELNNPAASPSKAASLGGAGWTRTYLAAGVTSPTLKAAGCCDGRDTVASSKGSANALVDFIQHEYGHRPSEAILLGANNGVRNGDLAELANAVSYVDAGRLTMKVVWYPKQDSSLDVYWHDPATSNSAASVQASWYLASFGSNDNNYVRINATTKVLEAAVAATTGSSGTAITWLEDERVELVFQVGGSIASVAKYRRNAGSWTDIGLSTTFGSWAPPGNMALLHRSSPVESGGSRPAFQPFARVRAIELHNRGLQI